MDEKIKLAEEITTKGKFIEQHMNKPQRVANFLLGWDSCETHYKDIAVKFYNWTQEKCPWMDVETKSTQELFELFLKEQNP